MKSAFCVCLLLRPLPGQLPMVGFPEISMYETFPWGGFGATPLPRHFPSQWDAVKLRSSGGFPYSEGISEDLNKVLFSAQQANPAVRPPLR